MSYLYYMRRTVHIAFVCLYLAVTTGLTVVTHFCGTVPVSSGLLSSTPTEPDSCCGTEEPETGCCTNSTISLVLHDDHAISPAWSPLSLSGNALPEILSAAALPSPGRTLIRHEDVIPPGSATSLSLLNCTLLI
jgi:hypothetical protein